MLEAILDAPATSQSLMLPARKWPVKNGGPAFNFLPLLFLPNPRVR